jgi:hypothetical protein
VEPLRDPATTDEPGEAPAEPPGPPESVVRRAAPPRWLDGALVAAALAVLGVSFLPWYVASAGALGHGGPSVTLESKIAWQVGVLGWLGVLFAVWAAGTVVLQRGLGSREPDQALAPAALAVLLAAAGLALVVVRVLTLTRGVASGHGLTLDEGPAIGSYFGIALLAVELGFACARLALLTRHAARS